MKSTTQSLPFFQTMRSHSSRGLSLGVVIVVCTMLAGFFGSATPAEAAWVYRGYVIERDSSTYVYFHGHTIVRGRSSPLIRVFGPRQSWTNSQGQREWVTLRSGTEYVIVDRRYADNGRQLIFWCYEWR